MKEDTIAAIATAMTNAGIGIIRVSGEHAVFAVNSIYQSKHGKKLTDYKANVLHYGFIYDHSLIDEVLVVVMKAPNSYTAEDVVEIQCHGGIVVMKRILEAVLSKGVRLADPGEFTKRAFLNGRIDLSEAEAVMDVINSKNSYALESSVRQLRGSVSEIINKLRQEVLYEIAFIESALDDPEHINMDGYKERLSEKTEGIITALKKLIDSADNGKILKEGIHTVIVGKPNAGKSSLLNVLTGEERAIVTDVAGTTRDILEENISLDGISIHIIDTAGIRNSEDAVEKIGVNKAKKYASKADLIIYVVDGSVPLDENDDEIINMIEKKKTIILLNKSDLNVVVNDDKIEKRIGEIIKNSSKDIIIIKTSIKQQIGIDLLEQKVKDMFFHGNISFNDEVFITNMRHKEAIQDSYESMLQVKKSISEDMPEDFYSIDLMSCYASLGVVTGEEVGEDLVNEIFAKFCMGK